MRLHTGQDASLFETIDLYGRHITLAQRALNRVELPLIIVMAAIFNGVGGLVGLPYLQSGNVALLPWVIAPVGLIVYVVCLIALQQVMGVTTQGSATAP
jgi:hypothetical protein